MALILKDRVQETSTTTGTGTLTLAGAVTQFQTFSSAVGNGNTTYYTIYNAGGSDWEVGIGTVGAGTLARTTILASSNAGSAVNFTGTLYVFGDYPAGKAAYLDANGVINNTTFNATTSVITPIVQATNSGGLALKNSAGTTQISMGAGGGDNASINVSTNLNGTNAQIDISPTGTGHVHINPTGSGSIEINPTSLGTINNMSLGATTASTAKVTTLNIQSGLTLATLPGTSGQVLTSAGTGAVPTWTTPTTGTVTSVTGTAPVVSSGGATPAISMAAATGSVNGYLTSTDWTTFNNKGSGTVTSVSATSPVTSSGGATPNIAMPAATTAVSGYLTSTDWTTFNNKGSGSVTSVAQSFTGGIISVGGSPITSSGTLALTVAGTSGGIPYFASGTTWATSAALAASALVIGGGAGAAPATTTTGTGVVTAIGNAVNATGGLVTVDGTATLTNKTLTNPTVTNYVETLYAPAAASSFTVSLANGTVQELSLNANGTITLPSSVAGKSFVIIVTYSGAFTLTWAGGSTIKWPGGTVPTASSASGKYDIFTFFQDGTNTYGNSFGLNY